MSGWSSGVMPEPATAVANQNKEAGGEGMEKGDRVETIEVKGGQDIGRIIKGCRIL